MKLRALSQQHRPFWILGVIAYLPLLLTRPGLINADTKQMLYLDPARLVRHAPFLWDPSTGMGNVTHQNIGYLFPSGPFFWLGELIGLPDWVTQRLWMGSILFAAGAGMLYLWRTMGLRNQWAGGVAALAYQLSPFTLGYITGTSVLLLPWAGLPTMLALTMRSTRRGGWKYPALLALVVTAVGAVNASSLFYAAIGVVLWFPCAVWVNREINFRGAIFAAARIGLLVGATQLWWVMALLVGGRYGLPILHLTETVDQVSVTSSAPEILRGMGYWLYYVRDNGILWWPFSRRYMVIPVVIAISFLIPLLGLLAGTFVRWRYRLFAASLILVGTVIAVGTFPSHNSSMVARAYRGASGQSDLILSMRNTQRATPLVVLGLALLLGAGLSALIDHAPRLERVMAVGLAILVMANFSPLWTQDLLSDTLHRSEKLPGYWTQAAQAIGKKSDATRVLEVPGSDFAEYRWGNTLDPVTPGLTRRPTVSRELVPKGSSGTVSLLNALDRRMQEGTLEKTGIGPIARLMNAGDVLARFDLAYERYRTPRPWLAWAFFYPPPSGLGPPQRFGPTTPPNRAVPSLPLVDEIALATEAGSEEPPRLALFPVADPIPIIHSRSTSGTQTIDGDGEGLVEAAEAGLLSADAAVLYAGSLVGDRELSDLAQSPSNDLILTDTNRRRAQRWFGLRENAGYTEEAGERPLRVDPTSARIPLTPNETDAERTVVVEHGTMRARATSYGDPLRLLAHERPAMSIDGDPDTAWITGGFSRVVGERILLNADKPVSPRFLTVLQPQGARDRYITKIRLLFDGDDPIDVDLGDASRTSPGQRIGLSHHNFSELGIEILSDGLPPGSSYDGLDGVGFAEISLDGVDPSYESTRLPISLLNDIHNDLDHRLAVVLARLRSNPREPVLHDTEDRMVRTFELPSKREFQVSGTARLSADASDLTIDRLVTHPGGTPLPLAAFASRRLPGDLPSRASSAIDGDPTTRWTTGFIGQADNWIKVDTGAYRSIDHLDLQIVRDGRHSIPRKLRIEGDNGEAREVVLPQVSGAVSPINSPTAVPIKFPTLTTRNLTVTVTEVASVTTTDWYTQGPIEMPIAVAELGIPNVTAAPPPTALPSTCRDDLLTIDGKAVPIRVIGTTRDALAREKLDIEPCSDAPLVLSKGSHEIRSVPGRLSGVDVDRLVLLSGRGGTAQSPAQWTQSTEPTPPRAQPPLLKLRAQSPTRRRITVTPGTTEKFWLVLGESHSEGWRAHGPGIENTSPRMIDGFANGWLVDVTRSGRPFEIELEWTPQRRIWKAIAASGVGIMACLAIIWFSLKLSRRRSANPDTDQGTTEQPALQFRWIDSAPPLRTVIVASLALGMLGVSVATPVVGIAMAACTACSLLMKRSYVLMGLATFGTFAMSAAFIGLRQMRRDYPADSYWPGHFSTVHWLAMASVVLLFVHVCVEHLRGTSDCK